MNTFIRQIPLLLFNVVLAQNIACVGNSITANGYPEIVDFWMEENNYEYDVHNFGVPSAGVMVNVYKGTSEYQQVLVMKPQHTVVMLGSNDWFNYSVQSAEWRDEWESEYRLLINKFRNVSQRVFIGTLTSRANPPEANAWILILNERLKKVAQDYGLKIIDFYTILGTNPVYFSPDGIHPNKEGKFKLARLAYDVLRNYPVNSPDVLPAPINFNANYIENNNCIGLKWDAVDRAQSYRVARSYKNLENNQWIHTWQDDIAGLEYFDFNLLSNITYYFTVQAF